MAYFPRSNKMYWRGLGVIGRIERFDYWDGERDAAPPVSRARPRAGGGTPPRAVILPEVCEDADHDCRIGRERRRRRRRARRAGAPAALGLARVERGQPGYQHRVVGRLEPGQSRASRRMVGLELERLADRRLVAQLDQPVGLRRQETAEERVDAGPRHGPGELVDQPAVAERLHRRDALDAEPQRDVRVRVDVHLDELDRAVGRLDAASRTGVSWRHGPHHSAQKSTTTGTVRERSTTASSNVASSRRRSSVVLPVALLAEIPLEVGRELVAAQQVGGVGRLLELLDVTRDVGVVGDRRGQRSAYSLAARSSSLEPDGVPIISLSRSSSASAACGLGVAEM